MQQRRRWAIWTTLLIGSGLAAFGTGDDGVDLVEPTSKAQPGALATPRETSGGNVALHILDSRAMSSQAAGNPFAAPLTPADPLPVYTEPVVIETYEEPVPQAPPMPFRVIGILQSGPRWLIQIERAGEQIVAAKGETIDDVYRVEALSEGEVTITYLPFGERQVVPLFPAP